MLAVAGLLAAAPFAGAHEDPPGCFEFGPLLLVQVFRSDGVTGLLGSASACETVQVRVTLSKPSESDTICAFGGGSLTLVTPDGVQHLISGNVPCIGGTTAEGCDVSLDSITSSLIPYGVSLDDRPILGPCFTDGDCGSGQCVAGVCHGALQMRAVYQGGSAHVSPDNIPIGAYTGFGIVPVAVCEQPDPCFLGGCDPTVHDQAACFATPIACFGPGPCSPPCAADCSACIPGSVPVCGNGIKEAGEACDLGRAGNDAPWSCCTTSCTARASGATCRPADGACDVPETCNGVAGDCPADVVAPSSHICRDSAGPCDQADRCDGVHAQCPAVDAKLADVVCRPKVDACDVAEQCDGQSAQCPSVDEHAQRGVRCGPGDRGFCDGAGGCLVTCGNDVRDEHEECDGDDRPAGQWCTTDCRVVPCGWREVGSPQLATLQALVCSLSAPVVDAQAAPSCEGNDPHVARIELARRAVAQQLTQALQGSVRLRVKILRRADARLTKAARRLGLGRCANDALSPAVLNWKRLIKKLLDALR